MHAIGSQSHIQEHFINSVQEYSLEAFNFVGNLTVNVIQVKTLFELMFDLLILWICPFDIRVVQRR